MKCHYYDYVEADIHLRYSCLNPPFVWALFYLEPHLCFIIPSILFL